MLDLWHRRATKWLDLLYEQEAEKVALAESTGLDQKQINNWFINQRKRHWKPSEDMQFVVMDGLHPQNAAALYMEGHFMGDGPYRLGPWTWSDMTGTDAYGQKIEMGQWAVIVWRCEYGPSCSCMWSIVTMSGWVFLESWMQVSLMLLFS